MRKSFLSKSISNHFKFIMAPTRWKTSNTRSRNETITLPSEKSRTAENMPS